ncbi:MAG: type II toxin-antitoxin system PemK/MazF family toxin [Anaerolineae bacterium]|jgi:mRNA interferase MazF|nr:type II toxin-antitoxin system PemK/MazF family toxin [Anaerolineae bacterium]
MTKSDTPNFQRGEIWLVNFDNVSPTPSDSATTVGDEINKPRPAVVMNITYQWNLKLRIVVPLTTWRKNFEDKNYFWIVKIPKDAINTLKIDSGANTFQVKSVSIDRFEHKIGRLHDAQIDLIADTIAFCIGYTPKR